MGTVIKNFKQLDLDKIYTYADYYSWKIKERVELIKGKIFKMSPAPNLSHQRISRRVSKAFYNFLDSKRCEAFVAPFDVRFPKRESKEDDKIYDVVQPDICVVCDAKKLDARGCKGAPDLIVEILSPGNSSKELKYKYDLYLEHKVKEYWIIYPEEQTLFIYTLSKGKYIPSKLFTIGDEITSTVFPDFKLNLNTIFTENEQ